jgi:hypothetical protein
VAARAKWREESRVRSFSKLRLHFILLCEINLCIKEMAKESAFKPPPTWKANDSYLLVGVFLFPAKTNHLLLLRAHSWCGRESTI